MHDIKAIRDDPAGFDGDLARRRLEPMALSLLSIDNERRTALSDLQDVQSKRNAIAKAIGPKKRAGEDTAADEQTALNLRNMIDHLQQEATDAEASQQQMLARLPNRLDVSVPPGLDESANLLVATHGDQRTNLVDAKQHFELGESLGLMEFESAARISGARFTVLRGALARLERALGQFMLDLHTSEHGYEEVTPPALVNGTALYGTGQLPKFEDDLFKTTDGRYLIPTAEVPLTNLVGGQIIAAAKLPIRVAALTDCYRAEAGSAGRDTRGMLRQHQFRKVELVSIVAPEDSDAEHERMTRCAETILERLELPYRRMLLCAGDTGFSAAKTYDLEVWLPGQQLWREISSCSTCRDFQARRMNARMRDADGKTLRFVHTLNGSGVAVGRALIAVMENYQNADGSIAVPAALRPYMAGVETITA